jgi:hypothetical protein
MGLIKVFTLLVFLLTPVFPHAQSIPDYDRDAFGDWDDADGDCMNTRHELLAELSTGPVRYSANGCRVVRGRWLDPYTGQIFTESSDLDVDHLVPLYWAWQRGAWAWSGSKREDFGNDPRNLFAVDDGTNRSKGADGPLEWLPPNNGFQCQYVTRFWRIVLMYDIKLNAGEKAAIIGQREDLCDG